jgi:uncharacterized protein (TIGR03792 family)
MSEIVVEELVFVVAAEERDGWTAVERDAWDGFLAAQPGFLRKEVWLGEEPDGRATVRVLVWWASQEHWDAVDPAAVASIDDGMGNQWREPDRCVAHRVLRQV